MFYSQQKQFLIVRVVKPATIYTFNYFTERIKPFKAINAPSGDVSPPHNSWFIRTEAKIKERPVTDKHTNTVFDIHSCNIGVYKHTKAFCGTQNIGKDFSIPKIPGNIYEKQFNQLGFS